MQSSLATQLNQVPNAAICSILGLAQASFKPIEGIDRDWKFGTKNHIKDLKAFSAMCQQISSEYTLLTYQERAGSRFVVSSESVPKYFALGLDTETTGIRTGVTQQTFRDNFPQADSSNYDPLFEDTEFSDISRYLRLIQLAVIEPRVTERRFENESGVFIREYLSVDYKDSGHAYLIYVTDLEQEFARSRQIDFKKWILPLKPILEDPRRTIFIMNAIFEHRQLSPYDISLTTVIDNIDQAKQLRTEGSRDLLSDDIEHRRLTGISDPGSYSMAAMASTTFGMQISKEEQDSQWELNEYSLAQIDYARADPKNSLCFGLFHEELLLKQDREIESELQLFELDQTEASNPKYKFRLEALLEALGHIYLQRDQLIKASVVFEPVLKLFASETILSEQLKTKILPALFEAECRKFSSFNYVPADFGLIFEGDSGSCRFQPKAERGLDLESLASLGEYVLQQVELKVSMSSIKSKFAPDQISSLKRRCFNREFVEAKLGVDFPDERHQKYLLTINDFVVSLRRHFEINPRQAKAESVADSLRLIVEARAERMAYLNQDNFLGTELGLVERKIRAYRLALKNYMLKLAQAANYISTDSQTDFSFTTKQGRAWLSAGTYAQFDTTEFIKMALSSKLSGQLLNELAPNFSSSKLANVLDLSGFAAKERDQALEQALPVRAWSVRRYANVYPKYRRAFG
jgi:hypothetical protein